MYSSMYCLSEQQQQYIVLNVVTSSKRNREILSLFNDPFIVSSYDNLSPNSFIIFLSLLCFCPFKTTKTQPKKHQLHNLNHLVFLTEIINGSSKVFPFLLFSFLFLFFFKPNCCILTHFTRYHYLSLTILFYLYFSAQVDHHLKQTAGWGDVLYVLWRFLIHFVYGFISQRSLVIFYKYLARIYFHKKKKIRFPRI